MARIKQEYEAEGFFGIGILHSHDEFNIGTLWRSAFILGASFIFTIDRKYKKQASDVTKSWTKIPLYHYNTFEDFRANIPHATQLVGVELTDDAHDLGAFEHPSRAIYLLGSEQAGLPDDILAQCHSVVSIPGEFSLNVAVTGSIVVYDRQNKIRSRLPKRMNNQAEQGAAPNP